MGFPEQSGTTVVVAPSGDVTGVTDRTAIQAALTAARTAGGGTVRLAAGTHYVNLAAHPVNGSYYSALVVGAKTRLLLDEGAVVKLIDDATGAASNNALLMNYDISAGGDTGIVVEGGLWDGNAAEQTIVCSGLIEMRARGSRYVGVKVKNCRGTATSGGNEKFQFSTSLGADTIYEACQAYGDAGSTSSGFSANSATNVRYTDCRAFGMTVANGFTHNSCRNVAHVSCESYLNALYGFNAEASADVTYVACTAGGNAATAATGTPFTTGQSLGNGGDGFTVNATTNCQLIGCTSRRNLSGVNWTATSTGKVVAGSFSDNTALGMGMSTASPNVRITGGPIMTGNGTGPIAIPGSDPTVVVGYVGAANPAVPATTVALTNPFPFDATVYVVGGTVTVIAVNGESLGIIAGMVRVPVGQSITLTYSVAPTWKWFID